MSDSSFEGWIRSIVLQVLKYFKLQQRPLHEPTWHPEPLCEPALSAGLWVRPEGRLGEEPELIPSAGCQAALLWTFYQLWTVILILAVPTGVITNTYNSDMCVLILYCWQNSTQRLWFLMNIINLQLGT